jgi:hypothetical protein
MTCVGLTTLGTNGLIGPGTTSGARRLRNYRVRPVRFEMLAGLRRGSSNCSQPRATLIGFCHAEPRSRGAAEKPTAVLRAGLTLILL